MRSVVEDGVGDLSENNDLVNGEKYLGLFLNSTKACWKLIFASYILVLHDLDDASTRQLSRCYYVTCSCPHRDPGTTFHIHHRQASPTFSPCSFHRLWVTTVVIFINL